MTSTTIDVHFKQTDEIIQVPVSLRSTMKDIIQYVSENSKLNEKIDCTDYYLVLLHNDKFLKNETTVEETEVLTMENPRFQLREKIEIREQIAALVSRNSSIDEDENSAKPQILINDKQSIETTNTNEKVRTDIISLVPFWAMWSLMASSEVDISNNPPHDQLVTESSIKKTSTPELHLALSNQQKSEATVEWQQNDVPPMTQSETFTITGLFSDNCSVTCEKLQSLDTSESSSTAKTSLASNISDSCSSYSLDIQSTQEANLTRRSVLADTYLRVTSAIQDVIVAATRDPIARRDISNKFNEINIVLCGSPRVGKSSLINAICQRTLAKTSAGLDSCTHAVSRYIIKGSSEKESEIINYQYNFWDTPGFENWTQEEIQNNLERIFKKPKSDILCMIYCASPGSFANLQQLRWLLDECMRKQIFCALVCTNKWGGQKRQREAIMKDFQQLLENYNTKTREENGIIYFGKKGLCTAVNSEKFVDEDVDKMFEQSGIDELILGIMESLDDEKLREWCKVVLENKPFWKNLFNFPGQLESLWNRLLQRA
ncbi:unnamed protein product [Rotaria magnacalcarata]|uniref:G domain-containing protein n=1 Tax=Rotaria magnacalcarata TaxID=392030 RepID=A0A8S2NH19_9BILA|nr:unnamed protein product [Rotaria magnacalcarata]